MFARGTAIDVIILKCFLQVETSLVSCQHGGGVCEVCRGVGRGEGEQEGENEGLTLLSWIKAREG